jgi:hypothetical protein
MALQSDDNNNKNNNNNNGFYFSFTYKHVHKTVDVVICNYIRYLQTSIRLRILNGYKLKKKHQHLRQQ